MHEWFWWFIASAGSFLILEARALLRGSPTLTAVVRGLAKDYPWVAGVITAAMGLLSSHFFLGWP